MAKVLSSRSKARNAVASGFTRTHKKRKRKKRYARDKQMPGDKLEMTAMLDVLWKDMSNQRAPDVGKLQTDEGK